MGQDVEGVPTDGIDDGQTVDLILYQRVHGIKHTARDTTELHNYTTGWRASTHTPGARWDVDQRLKGLLQVKFCQQTNTVMVPPRGKSGHVRQGLPLHVSILCSSSS